MFSIQKNAWANERKVIAHAINDTDTNANHTLTGLYAANAAHVGQLYFDQDLISKVEQNSPYTTNTQPLTKNADDFLLLSAARYIDPFVEYVYLGEDPSDGIFGWISMGMDGTKSKEVEPAAYYTEDGGVENEDGPFPPRPS